MKIEVFTKRLETVVSETQAEALLQRYLATFGFKHYAFTYYSRHVKTGRKLQYDCVSPALRAWHEHYLNQAYADVDRTLEHIHHAILPQYWEVEEQLKQAKNKREKRIRLESIKYGIDKGLSVPVFGPRGDFASLTLHQCKNETSLNNYAVHQIEWLSAAYFFCAAIFRLLQNNKRLDASFHLTKREQQCLQLTAKAWRVEQIARELKITPRTVNFHLQNINRKLGTHNKHQAVNLLSFCSPDKPVF